MRFTRPNPQEETMWLSMREPVPPVVQKHIKFPFCVDFVFRYGYNFDCQGNNCRFYTELPLYPKKSRQIE